MKIKESELDSNLFYFHGTSNKLEKIKSPSPYKPFFISPDIEFSMEYSKIGQVNNRSDFSVNKKSGFIYVINLDFENINILDCTKQTDVQLLSKYYPQYILDNIISKKYSVWSILKYINKHLFEIYMKYIDINKYFKYLKKTKFKDHFGNKNFKIGLLELIKKYDKVFKIIYTENKSQQDCLYDLISMFNLHVKKLGFNGFSNIERVEKKKDNFIYSTSIGIFNKKCISKITPKALNYKLVKKSLKIMNSQKYSYSLNTIDKKLNQFLKIYNKLKHKN